MCQYLEINVCSMARKGKSLFCISKHKTTSTSPEIEKRTWIWSSLGEEVDKLFGNIIKTLSNYCFTSFS